MNNDDDAGEDLLAGLDLHKWRVPPPPSGQRETVLLRALTPATVSKRRNLAWLVAAIVVVNALIATLIVIVIARSPEPRVALLSAGPSSNSQINELMRRIDEDRRELARQLAEIEQQRRELDRRIAELDELRTLTEQLADQLRKLDRDKRDRPSPKQREPQPSPGSLGCDEVACVLDNYASACCAKFRRPPVNTVAPAGNPVPDGLDRTAISEGITAVKGRIAACGDLSPVKGKVKVSIVVDSSGRVTDVAVLTTPDAALGSCVAQAVQKATFGPTKHGGSFSYPFIF